MIARVGWLGLIAVLTIRASAVAVTLENPHVQVSIDPEHGGAVVRMIHKQGVVLPLIADRGARVAGQGRFFVPTLAAGDRKLDLFDVPMQTLSEPSAEELRLEADLSQLSPGLRLERRFQTGAQESGLRITDFIANDGPDAREVRLRVGATSRFDGQPWNRSLRCWFGNRQTSRWMFTPYGEGTVSQLDSNAASPFWRVIGQYGTGFLYRPVAPAGPVDVVHRLPKEPGHPVEFDWMSTPVTIPAGGKLTVQSSVLIDTGGRDGGTPAALVQSDRLIVHGDLPTAGRTGQAMDCFVTVTSAVPRRVRAVVSERTVLLDWGSERDKTEPRKIASFDMKLPPGVGVVRHFRHMPRHTGLMYLRFEVQEPSSDDDVLTSTEARAVIDGDRLTGEGEFVQTWARYARRLPEVHLRGSWEEIGRQMARLKLIRAKDEAAGAGARLELYEKQFPLYARLLRGAAAELNVKPIQLADRRRSRPGMAPPEACMGLLLSGPDGPLHLYSKERSGSSTSGMGYVKVVPDAGYRYHMYTLGNATFGYGVNQAGLSTSGATINCDAETERIGQQQTKQRLDEGKAAAPLGMHMLLAMCADVEEAVRFVTHPDAPLDFTGNMLIADRRGNAVILESVGTYHQLVRGGDRRVATMGNYPHRRADGRFDIGPNWGWAANTMLRERLVESLVRQRNHQVTLADAFMIMATRTEPGGMCQHVFDNVGTLYSTCSSIAVLQTGDLYISHGPPSQVEYVRYQLNDK